MASRRVRGLVASSLKAGTCHYPGSMCQDGVFGKKQASGQPYYAAAHISEKRRFVRCSVWREPGYDLSPVLGDTGGVTRMRLQGDLIRMPSKTFLAVPYLDVNL